MNLYFTRSTIYTVQEGTITKNVLRYFLYIRSRAASQNAVCAGRTQLVFVLICSSRSMGAFKMHSVLKFM